MRRPALLLLLALTALAACGGAAAQTPSAADGVVSIGPLPTAPPAKAAYTSVGIVGDSITDMSSDALRSTLAERGFTDITIDAERSRRIDVSGGSGGPRSGKKALGELLDSGVAPDAWVIALGTNDVGGVYDETQYAALIDDMLAMLPADVPLVWVDVYRPPYLDDSATFNRVVGERLQARGHAVEASWFALATHNDPDVISDDHIHPNDTGMVAFATLIADALASVS